MKNKKVNKTQRAGVETTSSHHLLQQQQQRQRQTTNDKQHTQQKTTTDSNRQQKTLIQRYCLYISRKHLDLLDYYHPQYIARTSHQPTGVLFTIIDLNWFDTLVIPMFWWLYIVQ